MSSKFEGAPGAEHERLRKDLSSWAKTKGGETSFNKLAKDLFPDVVMTDKKGQFLFVGDAKDSSNETVDNSKTITRIQSYIDEFAEYFSPTKGYTSGFFAIATNDSYEASRWITKLNKLAKNANMNDSNGNGPDFTKIKLLNKNTWIVYW